MRRTARAFLRVASASAILLAPLPASAAGDCTALLDDPVGTTECPGVRPGALLQSGAERCTFGFLYQGSDRRRYAVTAGHCAFATDPATTPGKTSAWRTATGPVVSDAAGKAVGRFAYASMVGQFTDFALVRLDKGVTSYPQVCHFGGPIRLSTAVHNTDVQVQHYGQGTLFGDLVPARTGEAVFGLYRDDYVYFHGAAAPGDSGGPVLDANGEAVGVVTDLTTPFTGNVGVNRLAGQIRAAEKALKIKLKLLTAPRL